MDSLIIIGVFTLATFIKKFYIDLILSSINHGAN